MAPPGDDRRGLASMLASQADSATVTADRLAGAADDASELRRPPVAHLVEGEEPKFCFGTDAEGVSIGSLDAAVSPERGGIFLFTDLRVYLVLGVGDNDKALSLPYESITAADYRDEMRRHRVELRGEETTYHLWIPASFDRAEVERAVEYATYRHKQETPDAGGEADAEGEGDEDGPQSVTERLERLGDAHSRGLIDTEEFERRKEDLMDE